MKIGQRHYMLIIISALTLVATTFLYVVMYLNIMKQINITSKAYSELNYQNNIKKHEDELIRLYNSSEKEREDIRNMIVSEDGIVKFIEDIESIGDISGAIISLSSINKNKEEKENKDQDAKKDPLGENISARLEAKGSWSSIAKTLMLLENMPYQIYLNNISINTDSLSSIGNGELSIPKKSGQTYRWVMSLDIKALSRK